MVKHLSQKDYRSILKFYNIPASKNKYTRKKMAEKVLADRLCRCIKKVSSQIERKQGVANRTRKRMKTIKKQIESNATGICRNSVIRRKGLYNFGFTCKIAPRLHKSKTLRVKLLKQNPTTKTTKTKKTKQT